MRSLGGCIKIHSSENSRPWLAPSAGALASQRQEFNSIRVVLRLTSQSQHFEIIDELPYRDAQLVCVEDSAESDACSLAISCLGEEVFILTHHYPPECGRPIEQRRVFKFRSSVEL